MERTSHVLATQYRGRGMRQDSQSRLKVEMEKLVAANYREPLHLDSPACVGMDPALWINETAEAMEICELCPERIKCAEYAMRNQEFGIWGGTTEEDRFIARGGNPDHVCPRCHSTQTIGNGKERSTRNGKTQRRRCGGCLRQYSF